MDYSIIITASHINSHPSIHHIKNTIDSLHFLNLKPNTQILLAHDYSSNYNFKKYLLNLAFYLIHNKLDNIKITIRPDFGHLTGNIRHAMKYINTKYVLIMQHDLPFTRHVDINKVINDMYHNPELKHVRFNKRNNTKFRFDAYNDLFGKQKKCNNYVYTRTPGWSDQNHICLKTYYTKFILRICKDGDFMEKTMHKRIKNKKDHIKYGTYIFGHIESKRTIKHSDGRERNY